MKQIFFVLLISMLLFSFCNINNKEKAIDSNSSTLTKALPIKDFIKKFHKVQLPFYFKGWGSNEIDKTKLFSLDFTTSDSLFFKRDGIAKELESTIYGYGMLADTTNFYSLIYFKQAEDIYPIICTYSKQGELISSQTLLVHGCGSDCGLRYCSYAAKIEKDFSIYFADTLKYDFECDTLGNPIPNTDSTFVNAQFGKIAANGRVNISDIKSTSKKNSP